MNKTKLKKICSIILIIVGAVVLIIELAASTKNYYMQSFGIICLMVGLFVTNTGVSSKFTENNATFSSISDEEE